MPILAKQTVAATNKPTVKVAANKPVKAVAPRVNFAKAASGAAAGAIAIALMMTGAPDAQAVGKADKGGVACGAYTCKPTAQNGKDAKTFEAELLENLAKRNVKKPSIE